MGTSLIKQGDKATLRAGRNYLIRCRLGARFAILQHNRWTGKKFENEEKQIAEGEDLEIFNATGKDATIALQSKDPADDGDVRVTALSSSQIPDPFEGLDERSAGLISLTREELEAMGMPQAKRAPINGGGVLTVRIFLEVEGFGSFTAGGINTLNGIASAWVGGGITLALSATPSAGWQFSHWILNGIFGGTAPAHFVAARPNLKIRAVFAQPARAVSAETEAA